LNHFDIYCLQPRKEFPISRKTKFKLEEFGVIFIDKPLNTVHRYYGLANKPLVCDYMVNNYSYEQYLFIDGDTVIVDDPVKFLLESNDIYICPVFSKGLGISNLSDTNSNYWLRLFEITDKNPENQIKVETISTKEKIIGYWNSGVILFNGRSSICSDWWKLLEVVLSKRKYRQTGIFFTEQTCLSAVLLQGKYSIGTLSTKCNFPLLKKGELQLNDRDDISIIHHFNNLKLLRKNEMGIIEPMRNEWIHQLINEFEVYPANIAQRLIKAGVKSKIRIMEKLYYFKYIFSAN
jgi:hypothetical protein